MNFNLKKNSGGFTLIELIVSVGILVIITTIILANYTTFNKRIKLEGVTQEIASIIRQAQAYGMSSKRYLPSTNSYGVHFDINSPDSIIMFYDFDGDHLYDGSAEDEEVFKIQSSDRISQICVKKTVAPLFSCPGTASVDTLDVVYERSKIFAQINNDDAISSAEIIFRSAGETSGGVKIIIWRSGQVSVEPE